MFFCFPYNSVKNHAVALFWSYVMVEICLNIFQYQLVLASASNLRLSNFPHLYFTGLSLLLSQPQLAQAPLPIRGMGCGSCPNRSPFPPKHLPLPARGWRRDLGAWSPALGDAKRQGCILPAISSGITKRPSCPDRPGAREKGGAHLTHGCGKRFGRENGSKGVRPPFVHTPPSYHPAPFPPPLPQGLTGGPSFVPGSRHKVPASPSHFL